MRVCVCARVYVFKCEALSVTVPITIGLATITASIVGSQQDLTNAGVKYQTPTEKKKKKIIIKTQSLLRMSNLYWISVYK